MEEGGRSFLGVWSAERVSNALPQRSCLPCPGSSAPRAHPGAAGAPRTASGRSPLATPRPRRRPRRCRRRKPPATPRLPAARPARPQPPGPAGGQTGSPVPGEGRGGWGGLVGGGEDGAQRRRHGRPADGAGRGAQARLLCDGGHHLEDLLPAQSPKQGAQRQLEPHPSGALAASVDACSGGGRRAVMQGAQAAPLPAQGTSSGASRALLQQLTSQDLQQRLPRLRSRIAADVVQQLARGQQRAVGGVAALQAGEQEVQPLAQAQRWLRAGSAGAPAEKSHRVWCELSASQTRNSDEPMLGHL
jgi:hypothetical protein